MYNSDQSWACTHSYAARGPCFPTPNREQDLPVNQTSNAVPRTETQETGSRRVRNQRMPGHVPKPTTGGVCLAITGLIWPCGEICEVEPNDSLGKDGLCQQTAVPEFARESLASVVLGALPLGYAAFAVVSSLARRRGNSTMQSHFFTEFLCSRGVASDP